MIAKFHSVMMEHAGRIEQKQGSCMITYLGNKIQNEII